MRAVGNLAKRKLYLWGIGIFVSLIPLIVGFLIMVSVLAAISELTQAGGSSAGSVTADTITGTGYNAKVFHAAWVKYFGKGVLKDQEDYSIQVAQKSGVNPALIAAIMGTESAWGTSQAVKDDNNPSGQMSGGTITHFDSLKEGIDATGATLHNLVVKNKLDTVQKLGSAYAPVGAENDPNNLNANWVINVTKFMKLFGFSAAPTSKENTKVGKITLSNKSNTYPKGQCTWWAKARSGWAHNYWGNGCQWAASARKDGFKVNHTPAKGAIVSIQAGYMFGEWQADVNYGHVAYVEAYNSSKHSITVSQGGLGFSQQPGPNLQTVTVMVSKYWYIHPK